MYEEDLKIEAGMDYAKLKQFENQTLKTNSN